MCLVLIVSSGDGSYIPRRKCGNKNIVLPKYLEYISHWYIRNCHTETVLPEYFEYIQSLLYAQLSYRNSFVLWYWIQSLVYIYWYIQLSNSHCSPLKLGWSNYVYWRNIYIYYTYIYIFWRQIIVLWNKFMMKQ